MIPLSTCHEIRASKKLDTKSYKPRTGGRLTFCSCLHCLSECRSLYRNAVKSSLELKLLITRDSQPWPQSLHFAVLPGADEVRVCTFLPDPVLSPGSLVLAQPIACQRLTEQQQCMIPRAVTRVARMSPMHSKPIHMRPAICAALGARRRCWKGFSSVSIVYTSRCKFVQRNPASMILLNGFHSCKMGSLKSVFFNADAYSSMGEVKRDLRKLHRPVSIMEVTLW